MKPFKFLLAGALLPLLALAACSEKENNDDSQGTEYDEQYYASHASISSDSSAFTSTSEGGAVRFQSGGGTVVIGVDCGTAWTVENSASDIFETSVSSSTLTVTAQRNTASEELSGTLTLKTAGKLISFAVVTVTQNAYGVPEISVETDEWRFPAASDLSAEIGVTCSLEEFQVESSDDWLTAEATETGVLLTAAQNTRAEERSAQVVLTATDGTRSATATISVTQDAKAYISINKEVLEFTSGGGESLSVKVSSTFDWEASASDSWITVLDYGDEELTVTVFANESDEQRTGTVTLTTSDGGENSAEVHVTVIQYGGKALILGYTVTAGTSITLPLTGTVDCTVDWGDGSDVQTVTSTLPTHTYEVGGSYTVTVDGSVTGLNSSSFANVNKPCTTLTSVKQWGNTGLTSMQWAFTDCTYLTSVPANTTDSFAEVITFRSAFYDCYSLPSVPEGLFGNCPVATDFGYLFFDCESLASIPDYLFAQCPEAQTFTYAFKWCETLATAPEHIFAGCSKVTSYERTFNDCTLLDGIGAGLFADSPEVTTFYGVFYGCHALSSVPDGIFANNTKVTDFGYVFAHCKSLRTLPEDTFASCPDVDNFFFVLGGCDNLRTVPEGLFRNNTKVTNFGEAFYYDSYLSSVPAGLFASNTEVTDFSWIFDNCNGMTSIPAGLFDNCTKVTTFSHMCNGCPALRSIPAGLFDNCTEVVDFSYVFAICRAVTEIPAGLFDNCTKAENFFEAFYFCDSLKEVPANLFSKCASATDFSYAFCWCAALEKVNSGVFAGCSNATTFYETFYYDPLLTTVAGDIFDGCSSADDMSYVFAYCYALDNLSGTLFDGCTEATNFYQAFYSCVGMTGLPAGLFDNNTKVKNFKETFAFCKALTGESPYTEVDGAKVHLYERDSYPDNFTAPIYYGDCFAYCTGLSDYGDIPFIWGGDSSTLSVKATSAPQPVRPAGEDPADHGRLPDPRDGGAAMNGSAHSARSIHSI